MSFFLFRCNLHKPSVALKFVAEGICYPYKRMWMFEQTQLGEAIHQAIFLYISKAILGPNEINSNWTTRMMYPLYWSTRNKLLQLETIAVSLFL